MLLNLTFHVINLVLAVMAMAVLIMITFRTHKGLDTVFKLFLATAITLVIATSVQINQYTGLIPTQYQEHIFYVSRFLASVFFLSACMVMLRIVTKLSK